MAAVQARPSTMRAMPRIRAEAVRAVRRLWRSRVRKARLRSTRMRGQSTVRRVCSRIPPIPQIRAPITALGRYLPERVVTNADLEKRVATTDEWIRTRTRIREPRMVEPGTPTSVLAHKACQDLLERRGIGADEIDLIIVATVTPDMFFPATACLLQDKLGARRAWGF